MYVHKVVEFDGFLNPEDFKEMSDRVIRSGNWGYGHVSMEGGIKLWYQDLTQNLYFTEYIAQKIKEVTKLNFKIDRVYANGQTHGLCGSVHQDRELDVSTGKYLTFLIYVHPEWYVNWGGETLFYLDKENKVKAVMPSPNKAVLFDSTIRHIGLEPTRHCNELRATVAYKLTLEE